MRPPGVQNNSEDAIDVPVGSSAGIEKAREQAGINRRGTGTPLSLSSLSPCFSTHPFVDSVEGQGPGLEFLALACGVHVFFGSEKDG